MGTEQTKTPAEAVEQAKKPVEAAEQTEKPVGAAEQAKKPVEAVEQVEAAEQTKIPAEAVEQAKKPAETTEQTEEPAAAGETAATEQPVRKWTDMVRRRTAIVLAAAAVLCAVITAFLVWDYHRTDWATARALERFRLDSAGTMPGAVSAEGDTTGAESPYAAAFQEYPDIQGWLLVEGTNIDYPILQREGEDEYYLYRSFLGKKDKKGSLILDEDSSVKDGEFTTNLLVHGHNMKDGSMFGELDEYRSEDFYKEHTHMTLYTRDGIHSYEVIAVFDSQVYYARDIVFKYYNFFQADTMEEFHYFYDNIKALSLYDTGVTAEFGDRFLTLSTCAYHVEDGRFVVVAREMGGSDHSLPR